jgi:methionyl-tRNA formyltransferase
MKYVFFGTPDFSARLLGVLLSHDIIPVAVVCNPDRPMGRKKIMTPPPVKNVVEAWSATHGKNIPVLQPEKLDEACIKTLTSFDADVFIVFSYGKIFRKNVLDIPRLGTIGVHPSFLPEYRGASPFATALLDGKTETGVTLYKLGEGIDDGPMIARSERVSISDDDDFSSLAGKLADCGAQLLLETLPKFVAGEIVPKPQDEARATFTKKFKTEDARIEEADLRAAEAGDVSKTQAIFNKIRAFNPEPGAWFMQDGVRIKLIKAKKEGDRLKLVTIQRDGEKPKPVS